MANWIAALCGVAIAATGAGAWADEIRHSEVRLLPGEFDAEAWTAGVQIDLAEGWKTYWRMPGESGIAPHFDWSASRNVADVELRWPAPARYADASGETIGYAMRIVFPVTVRPVDPTLPVELTLQLDYAVCKDICIPVRVDLGQTLAESPAMSSVSAALIRQFDNRVPQARATGLALERASLDEGGGAPRLVVELSGSAVDSSTDIFVENFDDAYFRVAQPADGGGGSVFHLPIDDLSDPGLLRGRTLRLTIVTASAQLVGDVTIE
ncbi:MAG TPA: protein-disulfide reductase DsbD domain-containing protein [Aestuariivirgaceae bacterium]|nr:protein-disulfide reductase DsbD domain-containing protein [Aestuariivirgaceae bacterium]